MIMMKEAKLKLPYINPGKKLTSSGLEQQKKTEVWQD